MGEIVDGYLEIRYDVLIESTVKEISQFIISSGLFEYGGSADIDINSNAMTVVFSSKNTAEHIWDWVDSMMEDSSILPLSAKKTLVASSIIGSAKQPDLQYYEKVKKAPSETILHRSSSRLSWEAIESTNQEKEMIDDNSSKPSWDSYDIGDDDPIEILIEQYDILTMSPGDKKESLGNGMVDVHCQESVEGGDGTVTKTYNVIYQCDDSPIYKVSLDEDGNVDDWTYSDGEGNSRVFDNGYLGEMTEDLFPPED